MRASNQISSQKMNWTMLSLCLKQSMQQGHKYRICCHFSRAWKPTPFSHTNIEDGEKITHIIRFSNSIFFMDPNLTFFGERWGGGGGVDLQSHVFGLLSLLEVKHKKSWCAKFHQILKNKLENRHKICRSGNHTNIFYRNFGHIRIWKWPIFSSKGLLLLACHGHTLELKATFNMGGIEGEVIFSQNSPDNSTSATVNLTIKDNTELSWSIYRLPMIYEGGAETSCANHTVGDIYDPEGKNMASGGYKASCSSNPSKCSVGDLVGKVSKIPSSGTKEYPNVHVDLAGENSISGRTLVLSNSSVPVACALITTTEPMLTAQAVFKGPIAGRIYLRQLEENSDTSVFVNLFHVDSPNKETKLKWRIENAKLEDDYDYKSAAERCQDSGGVFNPYSLQDSANCSSAEQKSCQVGDMTGKHGDITASIATATEAVTSAKRLFTDSNLPLKGDKSTVGRSIFLYSEDNKPQGCASILLLKPRKAAAVFKAAINDGIEGSFTFSQNSPFDPTHAKIEIKNLRSLASGYHVHDYPNPEYKNMSGASSCSGLVAGGHWNPFGIVAANSPPLGTGRTILR